MDSPPAAVSVPAALARAGEAGPYFVLRPWSAQEPWRPLALLLADPAVLAEQAGRTRAALARTAGAAAAEIEERVAASVMFLGLASQFISPLLGAAVLGGVVPRLTVGDLWWQPPGSGTWPLAASAVTGTAVGDLTAEHQTGRAATLVSEQVHGLTGPLAAAVGAAFRLSQQVLRGNVASAVAGAGGVLTAAFPQRAAIVGELTACILALSPLRGTGTLIQPDPARPQRLLVRRNCCLYYRIPGAGICADCVLQQARRGAGGPHRCLPAAPGQSAGISQARSPGDRAGAHGVGLPPGAARRRLRQRLCPPGSVTPAPAAPGSRTAAGDQSRVK